MYLNLEIFDDIFHDLYLINFLKRGNATLGSWIYKCPGNLEAICNKVGGAEAINIYIYYNTFIVFHTETYFLGIRYGWNMALSKFTQIVWEFT